MATVSADRRVVTVVFADLSGFTRAAERLDPEEVSALLELTIGALVSEVTAAGGWVEKQAGDAILAVFGAPIQSEDDPLRAVSAAVAMRDRVAAMRPELEERFGERFTIHVGVNTGLVVMRPRVELPHAPADDFIVVGDTVNVAARLYQAAGADQIYVGASTYGLTRTRFEYSAAPGIAAKGKAAMLDAYECHHAVSPETAPARAATPFVGRQADLTALATHVEELEAGQGALVLIEGEPGVGKTRLLGEMERLAVGTRILRARVHERERTDGYAPLAALLRELTKGGRTASAVAEVLHGVLSGTDPGRAADAVRYLVPLVAPDATSTTYDAHEAEAARRQTFRAFRLLFESLAAKQPTIVLVDDWHWADDSSAALLEHLLPLTDVVPLLVVCTARLDDSAPVRRLRRLLAEEGPRRRNHIRLGSLGAEATARLAAQLLQVDDLPPRVAAVLYEHTGGNAFFVEEVIRSLIEAEGLGAAPDRTLRAARHIIAGGVPDTVQSAVSARVDRLPSQGKELLRLAAVIGRSFDAQLVSAIAGTDAGAEVVLRELEERRLLRRLDEEGRRYAFEHAITQETVYAGILRERRRELHRAVAAHLRRGGVDEPGVLAWHLAQAEEWGEAQEQLVRAGDRAGAIAADPEALAHYREAMQAATRASGHAWDPLARADLERKIGEALFRLGEHDAALESLLSALKLLGHPYPRNRRAMQLGVLREATRRAGRFGLPEPLRRSRSPDPEPVANVRARIYETIGWIEYFADPLAYAHLALVNLNSSERNRHQYGTAIGTMGVGLVLDALGWFRLAERYHRRALALAEGAGRTHAVAFAHVGLSYFCEAVARFDEAVEHSRRGAELYREVGEIRKWGAAIYMSTSVALLRGDWPAAEHLARESVAIGEDAADALTHGWGLLWLGRVESARGLLDQAERHLRAAIPLVASIPDYGSLATIHALLAQVAACRGDLARAREQSAESVRIVRERGLRGRLCIEPLNVAAELAVEELAADHGWSWTRRRRARRAVRAAVRHGRLERQGLPAALRCDATYAWVRGRRRRARRLWARSIELAEELGMPVESARSRLARGRWSGTDADVAAAEAALLRLNA